MLYFKAQWSYPQPSDGSVGGEELSLQELLNAPVPNQALAMISLIREVCYFEYSTASRVVCIHVVLQWEFAFKKNIIDLLTYINDAAVYVDYVSWHDDDPMQPATQTFTYTLSFQVKWPWWFIVY